MSDRIVMDGIELLDSALVAWHVRAAVVLATVALASLALRSCQERTRHRVLAWGLLAAVALPTVAAFAPDAWGLPVGTRAQLQAVEPAGGLAMALAQPAAIAEALPASPTPTPATPAFEAGTGLLLLWLAGAGVFLAGVGAAAVGSFSLRKGAAGATPTTRALFEELQAQAGTSAKLGITSSVTGPIVVGMLTPTVLLPREAADWSAVRLRAVLAHELGHVAHGDHRWFPLAHAVRGLLWFNPLAWLTAWAFFRAAEFSADEAAISGTMKPPSYAAELLSLARNGASARTPMLAAAALGRPDVGTRIRRLLSSPPAVARLRRIVPVTLGLLGAAACILLARPAAVILDTTSEASASILEASNLRSVPAGANRISLRRGGISVTTHDGKKWAQEPGSESLRKGHLLVGLHDFLAAQPDRARPIVVDADRNLSFAALTDVLYTASSAEASAFYLEVPTASGPRVLSISPPKFYAANSAPPTGPALRVRVAVAEHALWLSSRPSAANPPQYEDPELRCMSRWKEPAELQQAARRLCAGTGEAPIEMTYSALQDTSYGTLTDAMVAIALPCGDRLLIEAHAAGLPEPEEQPDCDEVLSDFRMPTAP